jgi:hypothetical protein
MGNWVDHLKDQNSISLRLSTDKRSHKVKKRYEISSCTFRFGAAILFGFKFDGMQNMIVNRSPGWKRGDTERTTNQKVVSPT